MDISYGFKVGDKVDYRPFPNCSEVDLVRNMEILEIIDNGFFRLAVKNSWGEIRTTNFKTTYNTLTKI